MKTIASSLFAFVLLVIAGLSPAGPAFAQGDIMSGQYLAKAAGCVGCHTSTLSGSPKFAGGRAIDTPFGTFFGPNITPDPVNGIGNWTEGDFKRALRNGERPDGAHYFPAFPYTSFTGMTDTDIRDLWAYLRTIPASKVQNQPHKLKFPFGFRFLVGIWKWLFFTPGPIESRLGTPPVVARGMYLVGVLGHCGECHTPRNFLGATTKSRLLAGAKLPEGRSPNLTPGGLKKWSDTDLTKFFRSGITPDGDVTAEETMGEVVLNTTSQLTPEDVASVVAYLRTLPELPTEK